MMAPEMPLQTQNILSIRDYCKTIPYDPLERDVSTCHGFRLLKRASLEEIGAVPEVEDLPCLREALVSINAPSTPFFTIGCEKAFNQEPSSWWAKGYLEFAFNDHEYAADAQWYFKLFFDFTHHIIRRGFDAPVQYHWELDGAEFKVAGFTGYSAAVWVQTADLTTAEAVKQLWCAAVQELAAFLSQVPAQVKRPIY